MSKIPSLGNSTSGFAPTRWTVIFAAAEPAEAEALESLCRTYWRPLYAYVRRRGYSPHDAQDLTQEFFARLIAKNWVASADRARGRFRTFLLTAMSRFLANEWDRSQAAKRGGVTAAVSIPLDLAEAEYQLIAHREATPEQAFERRWAVTLLNDVISALEEEQRLAGKAELFAVLKPGLVGEQEASRYLEIGANLALSEGAVKAAAHRLRQRYRELLRSKIAETVAEPGQVDAEMMHLFKVLSVFP